MEHEYILVLSPDTIADDAPNVSCEVYGGTKEDIEEMFASALEDAEYKVNIIMCKVVRSASLTYQVTSTET